MSDIISIISELIQHRQVVSDVNLDPRDVSQIEKALNLPVTGQLRKLSKNYNKSNYTSSKSFVLAVQNGNIVLTRTIMEKVPPPMSTLDKAFNRAFSNGHLEILKLLLPKIEVYNKTIFFRKAVLEKKVSLVKFFMPMVSQEEVEAAFSRLLASEDFEIIPIIAPRVSSSKMKRTFDFLCQHGKTSYVEILLPFGQDANFGFMLALENSHFETAKYLFPYLRNIDSFFQCALRLPMPAYLIEMFLLCVTCYNDALAVAAERGDEMAVNLILPFATNVTNAFFEAIKYHQEIAKVLLPFVSNIDYGLNVAVVSRNTEMVKFLLPHVKNKQPAIELAQRCPEILALLLE